MMSIESLLYERKRAARESLRDGILPKVITRGLAVRDIPNIGDRRPRGWKLVDRATLAVPRSVAAWKVHEAVCDAPYLEVDISGWGNSSEMALTLAEFEAVVEANPGYGWALVEVGQMQGVVACFRPPQH